MFFKFAECSLLIGQLIFRSEFTRFFSPACSGLKRYQCGWLADNSSPPYLLIDIYSAVFENTRNKTGPSGRHKNSCHVEPTASDSQDDVRWAMVPPANISVQGVVCA